MECANEYKYNGIMEWLSYRSDMESAQDDNNNDDDDKVHSDEPPSRPHGVAMLTVDTVDTVATEARAGADAEALKRFVYQYAKAEPIKYIGPMTVMFPKRHKM